MIYFAHGDEVHAEETSFISTAGGRVAIALAVLAFLVIAYLLFRAAKRADAKAAATPAPTAPETDKSSEE